MIDVEQQLKYSKIVRGYKRRGRWNSYPGNNKVYEIEILNVYFDFLYWL